MNFRKATDGLFDRVSHGDLAKTLGVSVATIRQARLQSEASAYRSPPGYWREAVIRMAEERVWHYRSLIQLLRNSDKEEQAKSFV